MDQLNFAAQLKRQKEAGKGPFEKCMQPLLTWDAWDLNSVIGLERTLTKWTKKSQLLVCVWGCGCVCMRERERERECVCEREREEDVCL